MADKVVLEAEVKSNIGDVSKDAETLSSELRIMGISLEDVKQGFGTFTRVASNSFKTIKAGLISTGIGAFAVVVGSLVAWFTKTKKGAEKYGEMMRSLEAALNEGVADALTNAKLSKEEKLEILELEVKRQEYLQGVPELEAQLKKLEKGTPEHKSVDNKIRYKQRRAARLRTDAQIIKAKNI